MACPGPSATPTPRRDTDLQSTPGTMFSGTAFATNSADAPPQASPWLMGMGAWGKNLLEAAEDHGRSGMPDMILASKACLSRLSERYPVAQAEESAMASTKKDAWLLLTGYSDGGTHNKWAEMKRSRVAIVGAVRGMDVDGVTDVFRRALGEVHTTSVTRYRDVEEFVAKFPPRTIHGLVATEGFRERVVSAVHSVAQCVAEDVFGPDASSIIPVDDDAPFGEKLEFVCEVMRAMSVMPVPVPAAAAVVVEDNNINITITSDEDCDDEERDTDMGTVEAKPVTVPVSQKRRRRNNGAAAAVPAPRRSTRNRKAVNA